MNFLKKNIGEDNSQPPEHKLSRLYLKDVKPGQTIRVEWSHILGGIGLVTCVNNDPETKKIFLRIKWNNSSPHRPETQEMIWDYSQKELANFHLLNQPLQPEKKEEIKPETDSDLITLHKKLNEALEKEEYEIADKLQRKIDKLSQSNS